MKIIIYSIVVPLFLTYTLFLLGCDPKTHFSDQKSSLGIHYETYTFPTRNVSGFKELVSGDRSSNFEGFGHLYLPQNASTSNKVPLMLILHGSGGTWSGREVRHAELLRQNGIGVLVIDTFSNRGLSKKDKYIPRLMEVNFPDQLADAFGALNALQSHPFVDGNNIGVMGYSMGGISTILAAYENVAAFSSTNNERFALHIAFYPPCVVQPKQRIPTGAPVVSLWGLEDESTPKLKCDGFLRVFEEEGSFVRTLWYEGASHGWNGLKPAKFHKSVPNFATCEFLLHENGQVTESKTGKTTDTDKEMIENSEYCVDFGYTIGRHDNTNELANEELLKAINQHMRTNN